MHTAFALVSKPLDMQAARFSLLTLDEWRDKHEMHHDARR